jgi:AcrR family transcriptional regulator
VRSRGFGKLTGDALAAAAGVGKQTIYRWWSSLGEVVLEAIHERALTIPAPETGTLGGDLAAFLVGTLRIGRGPRSTAIVLKGLMAEAQLNGAFAPRFARFIEARRAALRAIVLRHVRSAPRALKGTGARLDEVDVIVDMIFGAMWFRLLVGHAPLDAEFAKSLAMLAAPNLGPKARTGTYPELPSGSVGARFRAAAPRMSRRTTRTRRIAAAAPR